MLNVILCGYRPWAKEIFAKINAQKNVNIIYEINSYEDYKNLENQFDDNVDLLIFVGWSWIIPSKVTSKYLCLGIHPSDLPNYRGGSPIQNQVIDGIVNTKLTLITLTDKLDGGDIWMKEDLTLSGDSMVDIFKHLVEGSVKLLNKFFEKYPSITPVKQDITKGTYRARRTPTQSKLTREDFQNMSLLELYNNIRCLTDPYPNAYLEDEEGNRLMITGVKYVNKTL